MTVGWTWGTLRSSSCCRCTARVRSAASCPAVPGRAKSSSSGMGFTLPSLPCTHPDFQCYTGTATAVSQGTSCKVRLLNLDCRSPVWEKLRQCSIAGDRQIVAGKVHMMTCAPAASPCRLHSKRMSEVRAASPATIGLAFLPRPQWTCEAPRWAPVLPAAPALSLWKDTGCARPSATSRCTAAHTCAHECFLCIVWDPMPCSIVQLSILSSWFRYA